MPPVELRGNLELQTAMSDAIGTLVVSNMPYKHACTSLHL